MQYKMGVTDESYVMSVGVEVGCSTWQLSVGTKKESELSVSERNQNENSQISWWTNNAVDLYLGGNRFKYRPSDGYT
jgi:hypothetical protein